MPETQKTYYIYIYKDKKGRFVKKDTEGAKKKKILRKTPTQKTSGQLQRFNRIQSVLSDYTKKNNIKLGIKEFKKRASEIYQKTKEFEISNIEDNIDILYEQFFAPPDVTTPLKDIPFYDIMHEFIYKVWEYPDIKTINLSYKSIGSTWTKDWSWRGDVDGFDEYYKGGGLYKYLRLNFNKSPVAIFELIDMRDGVAYFRMEDPREPTYSPEEALTESLPKYIKGGAEDAGGKKQQTDDSDLRKREVLIKEKEVENERLRLEKDVLLLKLKYKDKEIELKNLEIKEKEVENERLRLELKKYQSRKVKRKKR